MNVISVDPAPSKDAVVFDGQYKSIKPSELVEYCKSIAKPDTLLCWDAPLTGPETTRGSFSQRVIERFFSRAESGYKAPKGISVLPYSGCPHWAISRACVGLPVCGDYDLAYDQLPFLLTTKSEDIAIGRARVIETHPALAVWLWCCEFSRIDEEELELISWIYKGNKAVRSVNEVWTDLSSVWIATNECAIVDVITDPKNEPTNDDQLDAIVGWVLGKLLVSNHSSVGLLGDRQTGSIAIPICPAIKSAFTSFVSNVRRRGEI
jgi:predicted RNase H-like nuclease